MKVRCYDNSYLEDCLTVGRIYDVKEIKENYYVIKDDKGITNLFWHGDFEIVKENEMEKTFREVIADIKEGEVWKSVQSCFQLKEISCTSGQINFELEGVFIDGDNNNSIFTGLGARQTFKLQRKEYTFEEAFKAYEEGKEIQSISSSKIYQKERDYLFASYEISKKWYINN